MLSDKGGHDSSSLTRGLFWWNQKSNSAHEIAAAGSPPIPSPTEMPPGQSAGGTRI